MKAKTMWASFSQPWWDDQGCNRVDCLKHLLSISTVGQKFRLGHCFAFFSSPLFVAFVVRSSRRITEFALLVCGFMAFTHFFQNAEAIEFDEFSTLRFEESGLKRLHGKWNIEMGGESYKEGVDQGTLVGFNFRTRSEYRLAENFDLYIHAKVQLVTRQIQARFADSRTTGIIPYEVVARYRFLNRAEIKVGAINMDFLNSPLLVSKEKSFPGFVESLNWGDESNYLRIFAAQSIPTTTSFESMRSEKEETPTFFSESVQAQLILGGTYRLNGFLTHFRFDDLPSSLAFESSRMGNSILGEFQANSRFRYPFAGWVNGGEICYCKNSVTKFLVGGYQIENREAPLGLNRGQEFLLRADVGLWGLVFSPYYIQFFNERDTVPAAFNSGSRGHNNRNGRGLGLELLFSSYNFRFVGEYIESDVIRTDPNQKNLNSVMLRLETLNVEF